MQFIEYGPTIPNELIHACSAGDVVFFCGAGVSQKVGVDGFKTLTEKLIAALDPAPGARIREWTSFYHDADRFPADMPVPYADLYQELQDEFGTEQVECEMVRIIQKTTDPKPDCLDPHTTLLELSRNASGEHPQLITTNIDILFERQGIVTDIHVAPRLPRVHRRNPFTGIAYLHGRLQNTDAGRYIFSSSDFGRAYLSEGWATLFLKELLESGKSIVFIGYSAADSTVKFLLQALHAAGEDYPLYAFEERGGKEVGRNWDNKGVTAIPVAKYDDLWETLGVWQEQKCHPEQWHQKMVDLVAHKPSELRAFEREQVLFWLETPEGRRHFNEETPVPPAEWICVFDPAIRRRSPNLMGDSRFDYLAKFGLSGERYLEEESESTWQERDSRFNALAPWFCAHLDLPITAWWAAGQKVLPEALQSALERRVERQSQSFKEDAACDCWRSLMQAFTADRENRMAEWDSVCREIQDPDCNPYFFGQMQVCLTPHIEAKRSEDIFAKSLYPEHWNTPGSAVDFCVVLPFHKNYIAKLRANQMTAERLHTVFRMLRNALEQAAILLAQFPDRSRSWRLPDWPNGREKRHHPVREVAWGKTCQVFDQLCGKAPEQAKAEVFVWPRNEPFFFDKFRVYAYSRVDLFSSAEAFDGLMSLFNSAVKNPNVTGQWMQTLKARWNDFDDAQKTLLEERICRLHPPAETVTEDDHYEAWNRAQRIWRSIVEEGISVSSATQMHIEQDPLEAIRLIEQQDTKLFIEMMSKDLGIKTVPRLGGQTASGFEVLVERNPIQAMEFLKAKDPEGNYAEFWGRLALHDRAEHSAEDRRTIARYFLGLPNQSQAAISRYLSQWFNRHLPRHAQENYTEALEWWVQYFDLLISQSMSSHEISGTASCDPLASSSYLDLSRKPIFLMVQTALEISPMIDLVRFEQSLLLGGETEQQVTCALATKLTGLFAVNADWTLQCLIPRFSGDTANAAWSGFLEMDLLENMHKQLYIYLKNPFLEAASFCTQWDWYENAPKLFAQFYIDMYDIISFPEASQLLRNLGDEGRCEVVQRLTPFWRDYLKPLLENGWPKDRRCKTETLSAALADAVLETGEDFPKAVDLALPFLVPTKIYCFGDLSLFQDEIDARISKYPEAFLRLLHRLVPNQYKLNEAWQVLPAILDQITLVKPALKQAPEYRRLFRLANRTS